MSAIAANTGKLDFYQLHDPQAAADKASTPMQERIRFVGREDWTGMDQGRHAIVIYAPMTAALWRKRSGISR